MIKTVILLGGLVGAVAMSGEVMAQKASDGEAGKLYLSHCKGCHGVAGKGDTKLGQKLGVPDFTNPKFQDAHSDELMFKAIKTGVKQGTVVRMIPYEGKLSDKEIKALVVYVRGLKAK